MSHREPRRKSRRVPAPVALNVRLECSPDGATWREFRGFRTLPRIRLSLRGGHR